jgi:hypothetical protein
MKPYGLLRFVSACLSLIAILLLAAAPILAYLSFDPKRGIPIVLIGWTLGLLLLLMAETALVLVDIAHHLEGSPMHDPLAQRRPDRG